MSDYVQKNGTGTIWKNDHYTDGGRQPYAKGKILDLEGNEREVALWIPRSDKVKGFNLTMQLPYNKEESAPETKEESKTPNDLPF